MTERTKAILVAVVFLAIVLLVGSMEYHFEADLDNRRTSGTMEP